jgi:AcrR family transcriptional regulator
MKLKTDRKAEESSKTQEAILDATEQIMREEGYAAVSSRRVAERAGLKSQLVHYHFGTMDDLFLALFRRAEKQHFERYMQIMAQRNPIRELWKLSTDRSGMGLIFEFMALANHRDAVRKEIARSTMQTRSMQIAMLTRSLEESGIAADICPANVLSVLMSGAALQLVTEESIGVTAAHGDTFAFVEQLIEKAEQNRLRPKAARRRKG